MGGGTKTGGAGAPDSVAALPLTMAQRDEMGLKTTMGERIGEGVGLAGPKLLSMGLSMFGGTGGGAPQAGPSFNPMQSSGLATYMTQPRVDYLSHLKTLYPS